MRNKASAQKRRRGFPLPSLSDHPLLRALIAEAIKREDTLAAMACHLGVTYERVAQWRRKDAGADISKASRAVLNAAAVYLGVPTVFVLCMAGVIGLRDLAAPDAGTLQERLKRELGRLRQDPCLTGFVPEGLFKADPAVQQFVVLLYRELSGGGVGRSDRHFEWIRAINLAALGNAQAQAELASLRSETR